MATDNAEIERAKSFSEMWVRTWPLVDGGIGESRQRLVWFVGISGYLLVNGQAFWPILLGQGLGARSFLVLATPLALAAVVALVAYLSVDKAATAQATFFLSKAAAVEQVKIGRLSNLDEIISSEGDLRRPYATAESTQATAKRWRETATVLLAFAFLWSIIGPIAVRLYLQGR